MHGTLNWSQAMAETLTSELNGIGEKVCVAVCPTYVHLQAVSGVLQKSDNIISLGAQNVHAEQDGAYTGEISVKMLSDLGVRFVIIGHSERRQLFGVTDKQVAEVVAAVLQTDIVPIICIGESLEQRESGLTLKIIQEQLEVALSLHDNSSALERIVIAYEPVWAIGTGQTATPEQAQDVHAFIRMRLAEISPKLADAVRIIYGGSVNPINAGDLFAMPDIDGALVGGASLEYDKFLQIGSLCNI